MMNKAFHMTHFLDFNTSLPFIIEQRKINGYPFQSALLLSFMTSSNSNSMPLRTSFRYTRIYTENETKMRNYYVTELLTELKKTVLFFCINPIGPDI